MAKYTFEQKKKIVMAYLSGEGGIRFLVKKYGYSSHSQLQRWIAAYKKYGDDGLVCLQKPKNYPFEKKIAIVELYISSDLSYQQVALQEGIPSPLLAQWVNKVRVAGPDALRTHKKGRKKTLNEDKAHIKNTPSENPSVDTTAEHVKELEEELLKLRIENAFLKELRRLRLEDEAKMRERQESSAASEDSSN